MLDINNFPDYFKKYSWNDKHKLFGYPADSYSEFFWISSLEKRFNWMRENASKHKTSSIYLIREMIQWGGSQNGRLQEFDDAIGECNLYDLVEKVLKNLENEEKAISAALEMPGMGLTYASKLLRFLNPDKYGALDQRIRKAMSKKMPTILPTIHEYKSSRVAGYVKFIGYIDHLRAQLDHQKIMRPKCSLPVGNGASEWRNADIEMALFFWAEQREP